MAGALYLEVMTSKESGTALATRAPSTSSLPSGNSAVGFTWLLNLLRQVFSTGARVRYRIEESTAKQATGTVTLTQASLTAGDKVWINEIALTAVAGTATPTSGTWSKDTSDTAAATSLEAAINQYPALRGLVTATSSVGVVTITSYLGGTVGNTISLLETDAGGGIARSGNALSGGLDPCPLQTVAVTFTGTGTANDTLTIGGVTLTLKASAGNENEITIGGSAAATATNTIAVVNANSKLKGLVTAVTGGSGIVTLQLQVAGRIGQLVTLAKSSTAISALPASSFVATTTETYVSGSSSFRSGAPA